MNKKMPQRPTVCSRRSRATVELLEPRVVLASASAGVGFASATVTGLGASSITTRPAGGVYASAVAAKVSATTPTNGTTRVALASDLTVTFAGDMDPATITASTIELRDYSNALRPATVTYDASTRTARLHPTTALATSDNYYYARVKSGPTGVKTSGGVALAADFDWSFTTGSPLFTDTTVLKGLTAPVAAKFAPDGRVFVAERSGLIKVFSSINATSATVFADLRSQVHNFWDRGLLGLTIDPDFNNNPYLYVLYTYDGDIGGPSPKYGTGSTTSDPGPDATGAGALVSGRLSRLTVGSNSKMVAGSEKIIVADWPQQFPSHSIGTVDFGPDGYLYASAGDGASFGYADHGQAGNPFNDPTDEGGSLRSQDVLSPGDPTQLDGTVIRVDRNTGLGVPGNPYYGSSDANRAKIIGNGLRNPYRFNFRPGTSEVWIGDVGWGDWEEINRLASFSGPTPTNFGWPAYEGPNPNYAFKELNIPLLQPLYDDPSLVTMPYFAYQHGEKVEPGSWDNTGGSSVTGIAFYESGAYPAAFDGAMFFADYSRAGIYVMYRGADGLPDVSTRKIFKTLDKGAVQMFTGPGGDIYYVCMGDGSIRKLAYAAAGVNHAPQAVIASDKINGGAPLSVQFDASASTDPDAGDTLTYAWDFNDDGQYDDATGASPSWTYTQSGSAVARLRVTDRLGATATASLMISVGNSAPDVAVTAPLETLKWRVGDTINFGATATDAQDGTLPASAYSWTLTLLHDNLINPANSHTHLIQQFDGVKSGSFVAPAHDYPSRLAVSLTVTDSDGATTTKTVILSPAVIDLSFASSPMGLPLTVNGQTLTTPFTITQIAGAPTSIVAALSRTLDGKNYAFASWSDGLARAHELLPLASGTVTANYLQVNAQQAYHGTPGAVPGVLQAEDFDTGGQGVGYLDSSPGNEGDFYRQSEDADLQPTTDTGGGANVGWLVQGEWMAYTVDVATAGSYTLESRLAVPGGGGTFHLESDGVNVTGPMTVPNTGGFQTWTSVIKTGVTLPAGRQVLKFVVDTVGNGGVFGNFNWFKLTGGGTATAPPVAPGSLVATAVSASSVKLIWADASTDEVAFKIERRLGPAGAWQQVALVAANVTTYTDAGLGASTQYGYRVRATNAAGESAPSNEGYATTTSPPSQTPFGGSPVVLPGVVEAENFDHGQAGLAFYDLTDGNEGGQYRPPEEDVDIETSSDAGGGFNVGWFTAGEWMAYTVTVPTAGTYNLDVRVATPGAGARIRFDLDGQPLSGDMTLPQTGGFQNWQTVRVSNLALPAGTHVIRLTGSANGSAGVVGNLNWFKFTSTAAPTNGGDGLKVTYYNNADLTGSTVSRIDPNVNFAWGNGTPDGAIGPDTFSARWTGQVLADKSEDYTFYANTDDGVRLWVDGRLLIDHWVNQPDTETSATIALVVGRKYDIKMEYFDDLYGATAQLRWGSPTTPRQIIPQQNLFSTWGGVTAASLHVTRIYGQPGGGVFASGTGGGMGIGPDGAAADEPRVFELLEL